MSGALAALAGPALFLAAGLGIAELLGLAPLGSHSGSRRGWPRLLGYGYLLGVAWVAGGLYALSHFGAVPLRRPTVLALVAVAVLAGIARIAVRRLRGGATPDRQVRATAGIDGTLRRGKPRLWTRRNLWRRLPALAALAVGLAVTSALLAEALARPPHDWDGRMTWGAEARYLRAAGTVDAPVLLEARWFITHPRYPALLPLAQVAVLEAVGAEGDEFPFRPLYALFWPALLLVLWEGARRLAGPRAAAWTVLTAAVLPFPAFGLDGGAAGGYSDLPLACFYGAGLTLLLRARPGRPRLGEGIAAGILLSAAVLAKNEGAFLAAAALLLAVGLTLLRRRGAAGRRSRGSTAPSRSLRSAGVPLATAFVLTAAAFALLASWRSQIPNRFHDNYAGLLEPARLLPDVLHRAPALLPLIVRRMASFAEWGLFWWVFPLFLLAGLLAKRRGRQRLMALVLALAAAAPLAIAWGAYAVSPDPLYLAGVTWNRMLIQAFLPLLLLLAITLRPLLEALPHPPGPPLPSLSHPPGEGGAASSHGRLGPEGDLLRVAEDTRVAGGRAVAPLSRGAGERWERAGGEVGRGRR